MLGFQLLKNNHFITLQNYSTTMYSNTIIRQTVLNYR